MFLLIGILLVVIGYVIRQWVIRHSADDILTKPSAISQPSQVANYILLSLLFLIVGLIFLWINSIVVGIISSIIVGIYFIYSSKRYQEINLIQSKNYQTDENFEFNKQMKERIKSGEMKKSIYGDDNTENLKSVDSLIEQGNKFVDTGLYEFAIKYYNEALSIIPNYFGALINRGSAYMWMGNFELAEVDFTKSIEILPDDANLYVNRGNNYLNSCIANEFKYKKNNLYLAIEDFSKAITIDKNFSNAYLMRGISYFNLNDTQNAKKDFDKAISLNRAHKEQCDFYLALMNGNFKM